MQKIIKILLVFSNNILRLFTGILPCKKWRKYVRENCMFSQMCPNKNKYFLIKNGKKVRCRFIKYGLSVNVLGGKNNEIIIADSTRFSNAKLVINGSNNTFIVGENSSINNAKIRLYGKGRKISIGKECMFSYDVEIWNGDGHAIFLEDNDLPYNNDTDLVIGNHVWICAHAKILKNGNIPDNSIVGMASVVNKDYKESNIILSGIPAKVVKRQVQWNIETPCNFQ